jgi:hypothetical protein
MRVKRYITGAVIAAVAAAGAVVGGSAAGAADSDFLFYGDAQGARIHALDGTVTSQVTAESGVYGLASPQSNSNSAAGAVLQGVATVGAVNTHTEIKKITGGWQVQATSQTGGVSLLNGAITVSAITTTATITEINDVLTGNVTNTFVGLHIAGVNLPANIPPNFGVKLGNIAQIGLNTGTWAVQGNVARALGAGIQVRLLEPAGSAETGASIYVSPVDTIVGPQGGIDTGHTNAGQAYGSKITANVGSLVGFRSDPTAPVTVGVRGTSGQTVTRTLATVKLGTGLNLGVVTDTGFGTNTLDGAFTHTNSQVGTVNLLSGAIRAKAITADADASSSGVVHGSSQLVGLVIGGKPITLNAAPNTVINVLNLGTITLNQQIRTAHGIIVRALDIVLGTKRNGLPIGAEIQVAVATASAT